jgi:EmrB/QacA subfamily drug resistance transporter
MAARAESWWTLGVVSAGTALLLLDVTVVNVALPTIAVDLDATFTQVQWVVDAYALVLAALLLSAGTLADRRGRRRVFVSGLGLFAAASLWCALATSAVVLDVARGAQGIGGAAMFATGLALLAAAYEGPRRGVALGIWGAVSGAALAIGPLAGGALVEGLGWEWIFALNIPLCLILAAATLAFVPESRDPQAPPLDLPGAALLTAALFLLVGALLRGNAEGWGSPIILGALVGALVLLVVFARVELARDAPMLDVRLFGDRAFTGTALVAFLQSVAIYPLLLFLAIVFARTYGFGPLDTGLRCLPITIVLFVTAPLSGSLTSRLPLRLPLTLGLLLVGGGLLLLLALDEGDPWTALLPGFIVLGAGVGTISPALAAAMVDVLPPRQAGLASSVANTFRQTGIAAGIAGLGALFEHRAAEGLIPALHAVIVGAALAAFLGAVCAWTLVRPPASAVLDLEP